MKTKVSHKNSDLTSILVEHFGKSLTLAQNSYDEQGRLVSKKRHNAADTETFDYNIRNWITHITSGSFQEHIGYPYSEITRDPYGMPHFGPSFCYNGNISSCTFVYDTVSYAFKYRYDELNRLTTMKKQTNQYDSGDKPREAFEYDKMGNIKRIKRYTDYNWDIDDLMLDYVGNQVQSINDNSEPSGSYDVKEYNDLGFAQVEFKYDANGNLISDSDRKIDTIRYNLLNLPDTIQFENGNQIVNTYDASGRKLKTQYFTVREPSIVVLGEVLNLTYVPNVVDESGTVYDGQFEHSYNMGGPIWGGQRRVRIVHNPEGYTTRTETTQNIWHVYNYYRRDHLGNNCAVWDATNDTTLQQTVYYASGLPMAVSSGQSAQPYKYNGKEFIEMHGYDTYDYGFRGYYPAIGRFTTVDPLAEKYYGISPYVYCENNPMRYIDLYGLEKEPFWDHDDDDPRFISEEHVCIGKMPSWSDLEPIEYNWSDFQSVRDGDENDDPSGQGGDYVNQYGNPSATLEQFANNYKGKTENQIVFGQSSFLGYKFPNDINKKFRFVSIGNGREVDMIHFMVVGRRGYMLGYANEIKQALSFSSSAFYPQDLYSNKLGINFFDRYGPSIQQNPTKISEYINWYLSNPDNW